MLRYFSVGLLALAALGGCEKPAVGPYPAGPAALTQGRIVRYEVAVDSLLRRPRVRGIVELAAPLTLPGANGRAYAQVKTFSLPDSTTYRVGRTIGFSYQPVPPAQQTPWRTRYEWLAMTAMPPGYVPHPEVTLAVAGPQ